jgi:hypothetical protein
MSKILLICLAILTGCVNSPPQDQEVKEEKPSLSLSSFYGNWVIKSYFDNLEREDFTGSLDASMYTFTEILIDPSLPDSLWLISEDRYKMKVPLVMMDSLTLQLTVNQDSRNILRLDPLKRALSFRMGDTTDEFIYTRVPDSLVSGDSETSSFREMVNCYLSRFNFTAYDPMLDAPHGVPCGFSCDGQVHGIKKYRNYRIRFYNGKTLPGELSQISLNDGRNGSEFGLMFYKKGIHLYHLIRISKPYESTIRYRKGDLFLDLEKSKK